MIDFHIASSLSLSVYLVSGFLEFQLRLKISKVIIIYIFYLKLHQRQTPSWHCFLAVCYSLKWVTPCRFGVAILRELSQSNSVKTATIYFVHLKITYSKDSIVFINAIIISISCKNRICLYMFVNCTVWVFPWNTMIDWLIDSIIVI